MLRESLKRSYAEIEPGMGPVSVGCALYTASRVCKINLLPLSYTIHQHRILHRLNSDSVDFPEGWFISEKYDQATNTPPRFKQDKYTCSTLISGCARRRSSHLTTEKTSTLCPWVFQVAGQSDKALKFAGLNHDTGELDPLALRGIFCAILGGAEANILGKLMLSHNARSSCIRSFPRAILTAYR